MLRIESNVRSHTFVPSFCLILVCFFAADGCCLVCRAQVTYGSSALLEAFRSRYKVDGKQVCNQKVKILFEGLCFCRVSYSLFFGTILGYMPLFNLFKKNIVWGRGMTKKPAILVRDI